MGSPHGLIGALRRINRNWPGVPMAPLTSCRASVLVLSGQLRGEIADGVGYACGSWMTPSLPEPVGDLAAGIGEQPGEGVVGRA
jgi:hypothetical protein